MSDVGQRGLLSIGVFFIILVIAIILYVPLGLVSLYDVVPLVLALSGCWLMVLAGIRASKPQKYERGPFSTFAMGLLLIAVGGAWLFAYINLLYSLAVVLLVFGALAIAAALKRK